MITVANYFEKVKGIDFSALPPNVANRRPEMDKLIQAYIDDVPESNSDRATAVIAGYIAQLNKLAGTSAKRPNRRTTVSKAAAKKVAGKKAATKPAAEKKQAKPKPATPQKAAKPAAEKKSTTANTKAVKAAPRYADSISAVRKLLKRGIGLFTGKPKDRAQLSNFVNAVQVAANTKQVRMADTGAAMLAAMTNHVLGELAANKRSSKFSLTIDDSAKADIVKFAGVQYFPSIALMSSFDKMRDKPVSPEQLAALRKRFENARRADNDPYNGVLNDMYTALLNSQKTGEPLRLRSLALSGLHKALDGCGCRNLNGLPAGDSWGLTGGWRDFFGDLTVGAAIMLQGNKGQGKSTLAIRFASYLAKGYKVAYVSAEEFGSPTLRQKTEGYATLPTFYGATGEVPFEETDIVFIDSVQTAALSIEEFAGYRVLYPHITFVLIFQATKDGNFRGTNTWAHDVDVVVDVANGKATTIKNRFAPSMETQVF